MTDHDPRAAEVLANVPLLQGWDRYRTLGPRRADELLDALTAAGLAVIETGSVPPWMEWPKVQGAQGYGLVDRPWVTLGGCLVQSDNPPGVAPIEHARPLYAIKEADRGVG